MGNSRLNIDNDVKFDPKARPVPYNYRISYKVSQLCLILHICCARGGCTFPKLHLLAAALLSESELQKIIDVCNHDADYMLPIIRFDPAVSAALQFAIADGFISQSTNQTVRLTDKGKQFSRKIMEDTELMCTEKSILKGIGSKLTNQKVKAISDAMEANL